jgi:[pyruvate, water dikinase]-phosphate phosphotransferase / [pyruvate, water dikinase] kinase
MSPARPVFFISDHTGITAEIIGKSLLSQFPGQTFHMVNLPFIDSLEKTQAAARQIQAAGLETGIRPLVFSTLTDPDARGVFKDCKALVMDIYGHFLGMMVEELKITPQPKRGRAHGMKDFGTYHSRIDAVNFTLDADDGLSMAKYAGADLILVGVSRSGKTPTSLYMAMQYGLRVANYPLTPEDFEQPGLPRALQAHIPKLWGLTLTPERLAQIREERRPNSPYSALATCKSELLEAEKRMRAAGIPIIDSTHRSVEEIAAQIKQSLPAPPDQEI